MGFHKCPHGAGAGQAFQREERNTKRGFIHPKRRAVSIGCRRIRNIAPTIAAQADIRLFRMARETFQHT